MTTAAPDARRPSWARVVGQALLGPVHPRTWQAVAHLASGPFAALAISLPVVGLALTTVVTLPVVPLSVVGFGALVVGAWIAGHLERFRIAALTGVVITSPDRHHDGPWWRRAWAWIMSGATWKEIGYHFAHLPASLLLAAVALGAWAAGLALVTLPLYVGDSPAGRARIGWWRIEPGTPALVAAGVGVVLLFLAPWVSRALSRLAIGMADGLLGGVDADALRRRVGTLEASRADVIDAAEVERRRIERDLHDGAQQRLVALAMSLGLAKEKLDSDPEAARALVDEAHREAKNALVELRDLARGLHPPVLTDRGLAAAVAGLAGRAPVPVEVDVRVTHRAPPSIEGIAYFVISEALTNVARHSGASRARVVVADTGPDLVVEVTDDGIGGATADRGTGIKGLADRVRAVDGDLMVSSPTGGPTVVRARLPLPVAARAQTAPGPDASGPSATDVTAADVTTTDPTATYPATGPYGTVPAPPTTEPDPGAP